MEPVRSYRVLFFGALKAHVPDGMRELALPARATPRTIKRLVAEALSAQGLPAIDGELLARTALAVDRELVAEDSEIELHGEIALLPPVSGG